ncbi:tetratricopeptide repeat protein [Algibacter sp. Ld11]|uniref:tetratricopeptide repeat protein n=1 Tax=Algibacter sp. Ld11 TaxID=649150 RepID=UPI003862F8C5
MKRFNNYRKVLYGIFLITASFLHAHGSLTKRIEEKTVEIKKEPKNSKLYFDRGYLYEQHEEFNKAIKDYLSSEKLGNSNTLLHYRKAQAYYQNNQLNKALISSNFHLEKDSVDVKINKLHAQILVQLKKYNRALKYYGYFIKNTIDITPDDVIEYSEIYLAMDSSNYPQALEILEFGLKKLGENTFSLQLQKLEYLEAAHKIDEAIEQYNYFILSAYRKEFWYYKKAKYLSDNKREVDSKIAIQQAKSAIALLNDKFRTTLAIKKLQNEINSLEEQLFIRS